jgi:tetratricopeptide (TPR) repeat protein
MQLQIRHIEKTNGKPQFEIVCMPNGKHSEAVCLVPPDETIIEQHNITLQEGLQWYLEEYLELPIETYKKRAKSIQEAIRKWGKETFKTLFDSGLARNWFHEGREEESTTMDIKIVSENPAILAWPWEALESESYGFIALKYHIERQLCKIADPQFPKDNLPKNQLNILYIISRPYGENDVDLLTLAKPLVDFAFAGNEIWPVNIELLRPPTFDRLLEVLNKKRNFYHIVHFDGHGGYDSNGAQNRINAMNDRFTGSEGRLVFEMESGNGGDPILAEMLGELLSEHNIPVMVLNACRSAMTDEEAKTPYSSVAASLLKAGVYSVVAMSYNLWVSGAKKFFSGFYRQLFEVGNIAEAVRIGRQEMYRNNERDRFARRVQFYDWIVPVLYQQLPYGYSILPKLTPSTDRTSILPKKDFEMDSYGFIGRDHDISQLEKAVQRQSQAGILIHGMSGEGKTTLVKGFLRWLEDTKGLDNMPFWFNFGDISVNDVFETLANRLLAIPLHTLPLEEKISAVVKKLKTERFFLVWDNLESVYGIPRTGVSDLIPEKGRQMLKRFLHELRGGRTKVLITSHTTEEWLAVQECFRLPLEGLQDEELWQYCNAIVADLGRTLNQEDKNYQDLLNKLDGNPLALRAVLLRLRESDAAELLAELEENFNGLQGDDATKHIQAALAVFERGLDRAFTPVLRLLGLHEDSADTEIIQIMLKTTKTETEPHTIINCFSALESAGLCRRIASTLYKLHPTLHSCLARLYPVEKAERRVFAKIMSSLISVHTPREFQKQRIMTLSLFGANFRRALYITRELHMKNAELLLIMELALYTMESRNFMEAERLFTESVQTARNNGKEEMESAAYHGLGIVAQERHDLNTAADWYIRALEIEQKPGKEEENNMAATYHQLGIVAQEGNDFITAERLYRKALEIKQRTGDEHGIATTYHQLGLMAEERRYLTEAENYNRMALEIAQRLGDEYLMAGTYHQMGIVAQERSDLTAAERWYTKALEIEQNLGDDFRMARTCHQFGLLTQERNDLASAEDWYRKSLLLKQRIGDEYGMAGTYHQLGTVALVQRDLAAAEEWNKKALEIMEKLGDEYGMAGTYYQLGMVSQVKGELTTAEICYKNALEIMEKFGDEHGKVITYHQLGTVTQAKGELTTSEDWYKKALEISGQPGFEKYTEIFKTSLGKLQTLRGDNPAGNSIP